VGGIGVAVLVGVTVLVGVLVGFAAASAGEGATAITAITKHNPMRINKIGMVLFMQAFSFSPCKFVIFITI
jgi:hypothetical protein